jgi:hypothetical protein
MAFCFCFTPQRRAANTRRQRHPHNSCSATGIHVTAVQDIPEIVAALDAFVAAAEPYTIGFDPPIELRALAAEVRLLPAMLDMGGCLGLCPNGEVASLLWDEPTTLRPETDPSIRNLAYFQASRKYPELTPLVPPRPANAIICPSCAGTGKCSGMPPEL